MKISQRAQCLAAYLFHNPHKSSALKTLPRLALVVLALGVSMASAFVPPRLAYADQFFTSGPFTVTITRLDGEWKHYGYTSFETLGALAGVYYTVSQSKAMGQGGCQEWVSDCPDSSHSAWMATSRVWLDSAVAYCEYGRYGHSACDFISPSWVPPGFGYGLNENLPGTQVYGEWFLECSLGWECPGGSETVTVTFTLVWYGTPPTATVTPTALMTETPTTTPSATLRASATPVATETSLPATPSATLRAGEVPTLAPTLTPSSPMPSPTPTFPPTRTPTRTATPIRPPRYSSSYYIGLVDFSQNPPTLNTSALYALGRTEAISETTRGVTDAIVVLHFGYPRSIPQSLGGGFGTRLLLLLPKAEYLATTEKIGEGALKFVKGFCGNSSENMRLTLALGANDSVQGIATDHGRAWARMIEAVSKAIRNDSTLCRPPGSTVPRVSIAGAIDIEPTSLITQSIPIDVIRWAEAYSNTTRLRYYNFGTCSNCPHEPPEQPHTLPSISPLMDDVWTVSWGIPNAYPLPQIYNVNKLNANQWYNLNLYAATCAFPCRPAQRPMYFRGTMTQRQRCDSPPNPQGCITADNKPEAGWQQLFEALYFTPSLRQSRLRWSTDIQWVK